MKKVFISFISVMLLILSLCSCGEKETFTIYTTETGAVDATTDKETTVKMTTAETVAEETTTEASKKETLSISDFDALLGTLPVTVDYTDYVVQDERYKSLYPDMLQVIVSNHTESDIKNMVVSYAAWDINCLPVKLKGNIDFSDGSYIKEVNFNDINLIPGGSFGDDSGFAIDEDCNVSFFTAIIQSFETFSGEKWSNPYYSNWKDMYEGVKYNDNLTTDVIITDSTFDSKKSSTTTGNNSSAALSMEELQAQIDEQEFRVIYTEYVVQDERYKSLYPDMLQAVVQNDTNLDIKNAVVAYVAWDYNNLPVKLKGSIDFSDGAYIREVNFDDINLVPGDSYGYDSGFAISDEITVANFKAIVVSYESFDGTTWKNPLYNDWRKLYEGVKLQ